LAVLPSTIGQLKTLEELELGFNFFKSLPKEIGSLTKLVRLVAPKNSLTTLPLECSKLTQLQIVDFTYNSFTSFPVALCGAVGLLSGDFSFCKSLAQVPNEIKNLSRLKLLNIKNTKVSAAQVNELMWLIPDCQIML
jgi:Leucine-rich repeat (LRR) protein